MSCYILDARGAVGVVGEMCLGGIGVSRGYINLPDLTAQRFVPDPFSPEPGARMFRTGDLGRLLPDGNFEILGRMDDQVKLKGYRIELDEVAAAMMRHPRPTSTTDELRDVVAAALPAYMVPAVFVGLDVMPTNTNGKTDKKALAAMHVEIVVDALQTDTERALAAVWSQVLGVQVADIGRATSFFALGGDSISAIRLVAKAKQQGLTLSSALIFKAPTLAKMALAATVTETRAAVSSAPVTGSVALTPIQHMFFAHDWINISHFNQSFVVKPRDTLDIGALTAAIARLAEHHDMLRARFAQGDDGVWSQTLLSPSPQTDTENVLAVVVESDDDALACIREAQESLSITHGPLLAVRLLHMHDGSQRLFFGIHHLVVDLVSWRVLLDDLETLLRGRQLAPKTLSFQTWAARMAAHAATINAAPWRDLIGDHTTLLATQPPATGVPVRASQARAVLDEATTAQLDVANEPFNTNIQELVLAALVLSLADVAGCASSPAQLCIELEGHGREPFAADLDVSSTVGWFTSVFPVAFSASTASDIGAVVRQVKHKIRSVPLKGLSYGMIKHLAPPTADNAFVKAHGGHAVAFNYLGRFQSLEADDAFFVADRKLGGWEANQDERMLHATGISCSHSGPRLVLSATVEDWIVSEPTMQAWLDRWQVWMQRVVAHCVDPATHGGRTVSDVPLMASQAAVEQAEAELAAVLSLRARDIVDMYPVTPLQAGFLSAMMRDPSEYTVQAAFDVTGNMDVQRLRAAWHAVAMAHPIVRTVFVSTPSGLMQAIAKDDRTEWTELDGVWSADDDALQAATDAFMAADRARGFSMASASFHRFTVARADDGRMRVFWTQHHSVADGWSIPLVLGDLMRACVGVSIDARLVQFRDHVEWLQAQDAAVSEQFWRESLAHAADVGKLAPPKPRESELTGAKYGELHASVDLPHLAAVCKTHGVTTSTVLRLAWALVLRHFTRSEHVLFGSVVSGRDGGIDGIDEIVGVLINTIAVPAHLPLDTSVATALAAMHSFSVDAIAHSHVGLVDAQRAAGVKADAKLFDTIMVFENYPSSDAGVTVDFALEPVKSKEFVDEPVAVDFELIGSELRVGMTNFCAAVPSWFAEQVLEKLLHILTLLSSENIDLYTTTVSDVDSLSPAHHKQVLKISHGPSVPSEASCIHHAFEAQAAATHGTIALDDGFDTLTYAELDARANQLAHTLQSLGAGPEVSVAVIATRSIEFVVGILGVLKAGAAFVPIEASTPQERIRFMLESCGVPIVATTAEAAHAVPASLVGKIVHIDDLPADTPKHKPADVATARSLAYTIFTSGTTGTPKGVLIEHGGIHTRVKHHPIVAHLGPGVRMLQTFTVGFDACIEEIFHGLCAGATMVLWGRRTIFEAMATVEAMQISPSALLQIDPADLPRLKAVCAGVEACPQSLVDRWAGRVAFYSDYGPTEATMVATCTAQLAPGNRITLGRPLAKTAIHILDDAGRRVPPGVKGRVFIGGVGIARGYLGRPDLTTEKFVADIDDSNKKMYDTGDIGRWTHDGQIEYLGRSDDQVKIKGYRIELEEVAKVLGDCAGVESAVAMAREGKLVAFVTPAGVDVDAVLAQAGERLPGYMVPSAVVVLDAMPMNTNGKADKKALAAMHVEIAVDALQTDTERALAAVWSQVLGMQVADIGRATSFFALGGDSISAIRLVAKAKQQGLALSSALIFKAPTLAKMALAATVTETRAAVSSAPVTGSVALTPIQHMFFAHDWINISQYNQSFVVKPRDSLDIASLTAAIARLAEHHDMLRARFAQGDDGAWSQTLRPPSPQTDAANVLAVVVESDTNALACIREAQESLSITHGPLLAVRLLHMHDGSQRLFFGIHHLVVDLVSWRVLLDDLETLLRGRPLAPKTLSFQAWAARCRTPRRSTPRPFHARAVLDEATTAQLDAANAPFNTNIQELVLAALVLSLADVAGCASSPAQLCIELEGHGREPFAADLDVSSTVGWFTSVFPVAFSASTASDIGAVVRQVKHKIRSVPLKGLSYGMIKHLAPPTADNAFVKAHGGHAVAFNYLGRFQSLEAADAFFTRHQQAGFLSAMMRDPSEYTLQSAFDVTGNMDVQRLRAAWHAVAMAHPIVRTVFVSTPSGLVQAVAKDDRTEWTELDGVWSADDDALQAATDAFMAVDRARGFSMASASFHRFTVAPDAAVSEQFWRESLAHAADAGKLAPPKPRESELTGAKYGELHASVDCRTSRPSMCVWVVVSGRDGGIDGIDEIVGVLINTIAVPALPLDEPRSGVQQSKLFDTIMVFENYPSSDAALDFEFIKEFVISHWCSQWVVRVPLPFSLVHHGFEARAKQHPDWRAVEHGDAHLSYGDLDAFGCALAAALASHGVQRGSRVAVVMQRSIEFVVALVGVLKAGATIVPVDSSFPADRIQFMLDDASVCAIVTTASEVDRVAQLTVGDRAVVVADARALLASGVSFVPAAQHTATGDDDAFIVYTSGSTGKPKGVPVPHIGAANIVALQSTKIGCVERARVAQFMAIGFDACQWETWAALSHGSTLQLGQPSDLPRLKAVTVAGEAVPMELKDIWASHVRFNNAYGPTEISIISHLHRLDACDHVHLGQPIANTSCRILDQNDRCVPIGVVGEMCLGGIGVSRGYINLPDLTAQRFVPDPFSPEPGARMFRTGDLGRLLPDGNFEILGRMDDQVKLKGYRIELDEVAAAMMRHPRVSAAAAVVKDKTHLVGFFVPADVDHDELRDVVAVALPAYMVPAVFVGLAVMPTNTNGKTDKKALAAMHVEIAVDALQTDTERVLAAVWSQVLGAQVADIGRATSFFALGGDSISAIRLVAKAKQQGLALSSALIFKAPTLAKMALAATVTETRAAMSSAPVTGSVALTPIQHMFFAHDWINISHFNQSFVVKPRDTLDIGALTAAIARLAEHHDMLHARFAQDADGAWSQTLLPPSQQTDAANALAVVVESDDDALACIREAQESLSITHGPLLAVRLLHMDDGSQRLFFGIHHLVVDLVSWRVLLDDLETLLRGRPLAPKTLSFQAWAARMTEHAATLDAAPWRDLIGDHTTLLATQPPAAGVPVRAFHAHAVLDDATTTQLDAANAPFNTNIQELVLAALVLSPADAPAVRRHLRSCASAEGHGREPFAADLDVSSTVGWFTSVFPVAFSALTASDIGAVVRQVKHKIRSVPLKGLSYGTSSTLLPTADNAFVKAHGGHAVAFNYPGRFQSLEAASTHSSLPTPP
ncbi:hypothetical protein HK105_209104 [Polyrhizophydium stewartii]|uniref:Carrier domain-containing protein n=1 Tax=Polyrhizophydium stewartii TaxID=2732419 RepID=A0ABR4MVY3_9FUNG